MTIQDFLYRSTEALQKADIATPRLDCLVLLEDVLGLDRAIILAHPEKHLTHSQISRLNKKIIQRIDHLPLAFIRGKAPFYGRDFAVDQHVLVPRPESETMIDLLKKLPLHPHAKIADIGTGSGCLGITAALELPGVKVELSDVDNQALRLAKKNARTHGTNSICRQANLLELQSKVDVVLANLPYVPERYSINRAAEHEPKHAIFGGHDGLNLYRQLWSQVVALPHQPDFVLTEALPPQHESLANIAKTAGYRLRQSEDFIQVFVPNR